LELIKHPLVLPTTFSDIDTNNGLVYVVQLFKSQGSLKDQIHQTDPQYSYDKKYRIAGKPLNERTIALFGRQILEGLIYFEKIGYPYGQLSTSNVIVDNGVCKLSSYENSLFGLSNPNTEELFAPTLRQYRKANKNRKLLNVLQFGHVFYEMAFGSVLETAVPTFQLPKCSRKVADVRAPLVFFILPLLGFHLHSSVRRQAIEFIFGKQEIPDRFPTDDPESADACPFPTVQELIKYPFFADMVTKLKITDLTFEAVSTSTPLRLFSIEPSLFNACFSFLSFPLTRTWKSFSPASRTRKS